MLSHNKNSLDHSKSLAQFYSILFTYIVINMLTTLSYNKKGNSMQLKKELDDSTSVLNIYKVCEK